MNLSFSSIARPVVMAATVAACCLLAGCAAETGWPKMSDFSSITQKVLSPQEQEQAVQSMAAEQKAEQAKAIAKIEKNK